MPEIIFIAPPDDVSGLGRPGAEYGGPAVHGEACGGQASQADRVLESVSSRVLRRLVYLGSVVAGCDCSWLFWLTSATRARLCSVGFACRWRSAAGWC